MNNINVVKDPFLSTISTKGIIDQDKIFLNIGANLRNELIEKSTEIFFYIKKQ